jgi:hypothetical protein
MATIVPVRFSQPSLQGGVSGDVVGVLAAFLGGPDFGGQFNSGTINSGTNATTPVIHAPGYNNFLVVETHLGGTLAISVQELEPTTDAILFTDSLGSAVAGTTRYNLFAPAGTRSGDPVIRFQLLLAASVSNCTSIVLRLFCSNR